MNTEIFFKSAKAGKDVKILVNRHCMKDMVFYSFDFKEQETTTECHFMTYDKDEWKYKFVASPSRNNWKKLEEEFSEFIFNRFHSHCQN